MTSNRDPMRGFTPERWEIIEHILSGQSDSKISLASAAREAGVTPDDIRRWKSYSQRALPSEDPLILKIAPFLNSVEELQAGRVEDMLWSHAVKGVEEKVYYKGEEVDTRRKYNHRLMMNLLEVRDKKYLEKHKVAENISIEQAAEIFIRMQSAQRIAKADMAEKNMKDGAISLTENDEGVFE